MGDSWRLEKDEEDQASRRGGRGGLEDDRVNLIVESRCSRRFKAIAVFG